MASTASSAGVVAQGSITYAAGVSPQYAFTYPQGYNAYQYQPAWQPQAPVAYDQHAAYAQVPTAEGAPPPPPSTEAPASQGTQQAQSQAYQQFSGNTGAFWQKHQDYHQQQQQQQQQAFQHYAHQPQVYYSGHGHAPPASAAAQAQAAPAAAWPPAAHQHPAQQPNAPAQTYTAAQPTGTYPNHNAAASVPKAQPGYIAMPNGQYKPIPRAEPEQLKPFVIKPNMPHKQNKRKFTVTAPGIAANPAYIKVQDASQPQPAVSAPAGLDNNPPALKTFVERCFQHPTFKGPDKADLHEKLKALVTSAQTQGELWTRDWDSTPVPVITDKDPSDRSGPQAPQPTAKAKWAVSAKKPFQAKFARQPEQLNPQLPSASPARSAESDLSDHSYSYSYSRSRSRSPYPRSRSSDRSMSPESTYRSPQGRQGSGRGKAQASPGGWHGKNPKRAPAPEPTKKQRKAERKLAKQKAKAEAQKNRKRSLPVDDNDGPTPEELHRRKMRSGRFANDAFDQSRAHVPVYAAELRSGGAAHWADNDTNGEYRVAQGTCCNLEKKYFRLTGPPDPSTVRPPPVLWQALKRVVQRYRAGQCDMHYTEDQLKAMRQDATVQSLKGRLPVQIYEAHARACLEHGDSGGFNQCQTVLKVLYGEGSQGCLGEFVAYRILYQSVFRKRESASLLQELENLTPQVAAHPAVAHALKVRKALVFARYTTFFQLYAAAPNLGRALMDTCFSKVRFAALETIVDGCKASKVKMLQLASMLGFLVEPSKLAQLETAAHQQSTEVELDGSDSMVLPGCRQTSYSGKYPAEGNAASAVGATEQWLMKCNAVVLLQAIPTPNQPPFQMLLSLELQLAQRATRASQPAQVIQARLLRSTNNAEPSIAS